MINVILQTTPIEVDLNTDAINVSMIEEIFNIELTGRKGLDGVDGTDGAAISYVELTADHNVSDEEDNNIFFNTDATGIISIGFDGPTATKNYGFKITSENGFRLVPPSGGSFYWAGSIVTGSIASTTIGASVIATKFAPDKVFLETHGSWGEE